MGIQSSINSLLSQAQNLATFYAGYGKAKQIVGEQAKAAGEAETQTEIAAGNAPKTPEGKVDPEWLKQRRESYMIDPKVVSRLIRTNQELRKQISTDMAKAQVKDREDTIKQSKKDFDDHVANFVKIMNEGSERP